MNARSSLSIGTAVLLLLVSLAAVVGGIMLVMEPSGTTLDLSVNLLSDSPFSDFLIPGIILLAVIGAVGLVGAFIVLKDYRYSGFAAMGLGAALVIWIAAEVYWLGWDSWLMPTFMAVGVIEMIMGFLMEAGHHEKWKWFGGHHPHVH